MCLKIDNVHRRARNFAAGLAVAAAVLAAGAARAGNPVPGAAAMLNQIPGGIVRTATTGRDGRFSFTNLPPGTYELRITKSVGADGKVRTTRSAENHNSSRSNRGQQRSNHLTVDITLLPQINAGPSPAMRFVIPPGAPGTISGKIEYERAGGAPAKK